MADYKGNTCPVCKQKFKEADDIVVCPDCGTPYHRECWKKVGVCVHQADHAAGFEWTPDNVISDRPDDIVCPNCGTHNPLGAKYCNHCGVSLPDHPDNVQYQLDHPAPGGNGPVYANGSYQAGGTPQYRQAPLPRRPATQRCPGRNRRHQLGSRFYLPWCLHRSRGSGIFPDGTGPERRNPVFDDVKI